jgi:hypothetical protein
VGLFKSDRENDVLSGALSNTKHTGCIRGITSQMPWKVGFPNDAWSYKKRDRYKRNLEDAIEEKMNSMFETKFRSYMQCLTQERLLEFWQITQNLLLPPHLSSIGSTVAVPMCTIVKWHAFIGHTNLCQPIGKPTEITQLPSARGS